MKTAALVVAALLVFGASVLLVDSELGKTIGSALAGLFAWLAKRSRHKPEKTIDEHVEASKTIDDQFEELQATTQKAIDDRRAEEAAAVVTLEEKAEGARAELAADPVDFANALSRRRRSREG